MDLGLPKQFHTEETLVSYGRNSSFIRKKLHFHQEETFSDPVERGQKIDELSEKHYLRAVKQSRSCPPHQRM